MNIMKKIYKLIKMSVNKYYLELMFVLINFYQQQKFMKKDILAEILFLRKKDKKHQKEKLVVNVLESIQVMQKMALIYIMRLVIQKHFLMSLKADNQKKKNQKRKNQKKKSNKKIKELEDKQRKEEESNKKIKELEVKIKELEDKIKNLTTNQSINNFGKLIIKT